ncbi:hypothetical protein H310_12986 [Aphanomyces invadans]|uniref:RING-type E3 ubiquitin transferase BRCA1 n=1 Tax=Aphanomyces invadans TaxID=157072 RepID=A0A024TGP5_9STRA|nr:hypothetical protein H310_12986 [Aphanomyces invadans]ETV92756.1 hypothetical protein H310_12986 [Aphanomyces invadans]|eukprot:XP_008878526.1 hypothetical protein H310_12986 [Aphanomyces invadans]
MPVGTAVMRELNVIREELRCFICHETLRDPHCLGCNHNYCKQCIDVQLRKAVPQCPKCKIPMCPSDVHRNQFLDGLLQEWRLVEAAISTTSPSPTDESAVESIPVARSSPAVKRKLPLDFASSPPPLHSSIVSTQNDAEPGVTVSIDSNCVDSMASLMNTPQLKAYHATLQRHAADLDESFNHSSHVSSPNVVASCSQTLPPPGAPGANIETSCPEPPLPRHPPSQPLPVSPTHHPHESPSTSSQETAMPISTPSPILLVPQSPPRSTVSFHLVRHARAATALPVVVAATQDDSDEECVPETELQGYRDSAGNESQAAAICPPSPTETAPDHPVAYTTSPRDRNVVPDVNSPSFRILDGSPTDPTAASRAPANQTNRVCIVATHVSKSHRRLVLDCVRCLGGRFGVRFHPSSKRRPGFMHASDDPLSTTHVVTSADAAMRCSRTLSVLLGMSHGCWIVSMEWVLASSKARRWVDEAPFEIAGDTSALQATAVPRRCRLLRNTQIFQGMCVMPLHAPIEQIDAMEKVVVACGGMWRPYQHGQHAGENVVGVVSKTLSLAACSALVATHAATRRKMPIVRVAWIVDSISHMECQPFAKYTVALYEK